jgi:hypothetical protein
MRGEQREHVCAKSTREAVIHIDWWRSEVVSLPLRYHDEG